MQTSDIKKANKLWNAFVYKNPDTLQKARQFLLRFYIQKARHFTLRDFHENPEVGIFIQKAWHFVLCDVFIYKNPDTSQKSRQFALHFYIQKVGHFALRDFSCNFWFWRKGGEGVIWKTNALCITFLYAKTVQMRYIFIYKNPNTLRYIFICKKTHFALRFYI